MSRNGAAFLSESCEELTQGRHPACVNEGPASGGKPTILSVDGNEQGAPFYGLLGTAGAVAFRYRTRHSGAFRPFSSDHRKLKLVPTVNCSILVLCSGVPDELWKIAPHVVRDFG